MAKLARKAQVAVKQQTNLSAATLANTDAVVHISNPVFTPEVESLDRNIVNDSLSPFGKISGKRSATLSFSTELKGGGSAGTAPELDQLFEACGYTGTTVGSTSVTYAPVSELNTGDGFYPFTMGFYVDGIRYLMSNAFGSFNVSLSAGQIPTIDWSFQGLYESKSDTALLTGLSAPTTQPEAFLGATFTVGGGSYAPCFNNLTIDAANEVVFEECATEASGYKQAVIVGRSPNGSIDPTLDPVATYDFVDEMLTDSTGAMNCVIGSTAGNIVTIAAPAVMIDSVGFTELNGGIAGENVNLRFVRNATSGDDELTIKFT